MATSPPPLPPLPSRSLEGMEVPIVGSDKVRWIELTVPSTRPSPPPPPSEPVAPLSRNASSCHVIPGDPPSYLIWRIHKDLPNVLEVVELFPHKEFPEAGVRLLFSEALFPFAFICKDESRAGNRYLLYALMVPGVAYLFKLGSLSSYVSGSIFPQSELIEFDAQTDSKITSVAATFGCLGIGRQDGSVACYQLGILDQSAPGFGIVLRDDVSRLWSLVSRGRVVSMVQDLVFFEVCGRKLIFVLHSDGMLRAWDFSSHARILSHNICVQELTVSELSRFWVGEANYDKSLIPLAVLCGCATDADSEMIAVYGLHYNVADKITISADSSMRSITLDEGRLIDLKLTSNKLWILKDDGSMFYDLFHLDIKMEHACTYGLQEDFVADQLFQGPDQPSDDLFWNESSIFSSMKDQVPYFISSIFLRRLLQPGVHQSAALRATILDHKKYLTDYEFQSLTVAGLKREIFSIIDSEGVATNRISMLYYWKNFCAQFFHHWCQNSVPYSIFVDSSTGAIGLIRKGSISLFRCLEHFELLIYGSYYESRDIRRPELILPDNDLDSEILFEVLRCMSNINHQLGRASAAVVYESLINPQSVSSEEIIPHLLKILETGFCSSIAPSLSSQLGVDATWEKKQADHKSHRKFSVDMMLSFHALHAKAATWGRVLDAVEKYLKNFIPVKCVQNIEPKAYFNINSCLLVQATSQITRVMLESAFDLLLLLGYLVNISMQVHMVQDDVSRIKLSLVPMTQDILVQWLTLYFLGTTSTESPTLEEFSSRLSSLHIDNKSGNRSWDGKLGNSDITLACLLDFPNSFEDQSFLCSTSFVHPRQFINSTRNFCSWIIWGRTGEDSPFSFCPTIEIASILLSHGQYEAAENLLGLMDAHTSKKRVSYGVQSVDGEWCACLHLLGFCLLVRAQSGFHGILKEQKISEAVRCFFRAALVEGASLALQNLSFHTGLPNPVDTGPTTAVWKFYYYQWSMQIFEQYNMNEGACQFALAALEQVDEVLSLRDHTHGDDLLPEPATAIRGRLWANVFKFMLDLNNYSNAYCAIISNPDEDSKHICLRRFVIVLCERGATKVLCDGSLPFVGLMEKVEQELVWKAERSDVTARPNLYKLLYSFETYHNNWRRAASYMYRYTTRLKNEANFKEHHQLSSALQERLCGLSATISALQLVNPAHAWIDSQPGAYCCPDQCSPNKRPRKLPVESTSATIDPKSWRTNRYTDIETLEKEYVLTSAQYLLVLAKDKSAVSGSQTHLETIVDILVQSNFYDMAFTMLFKFWKGSGLKRELERVFVAISHKCCENIMGSLFAAANMRTHGLLLTSSVDGTCITGKTDTSPAIYQSKGNAQWETLEIYLGKYKKFHPRLPVIVAETLLHTNPQIELPLWLVHMFKGGRRATSWGMTGQESDPATLFRLYVDYSRYAEATNLLLEYIESFASLKPADIINRKKMSAIWFPYIAIERLWFQLEETQCSGHMVDQCDTLKRLLNGALLNHLKQVKLDSDDTLASAFV